MAAPLPSLARRPVATIAIAFVIVELAVASRYGLHRDELYFLACGRHLAWGYVDQPPLVPALARVSSALLGPHAFALRIVPALAGGATVTIAALIARELRGGRMAQTAAALATALSPAYLGVAHVLATATFDVFFWAVLSWLLVRLLRTGDARMWLAIGATSGLALLNKWNVLFLLGAAAVGLAVTPAHRRHLRSPWFAGGVALALAIWSPNLAWNARHHWAALTMMRRLHAENATLGASVAFIPVQLFLMGPVLAYLWLRGVQRLRSHHVGRVLAVTYVALVVAYVATGAKPYYIAGFYVPLFAAGGVWYEERLAARAHAGDHPHPRRTAAILLLVSLPAVPIALPVLPASALPKSESLGNINKELGATLGWDDVVRQIGRVAASLPASERAHVVVFTGDYGAAGAVDRFGARFGLPHAISGHNNYWWWGPAPARDGATTIAVNLDRSYLETIFDEVSPAGTVHTPNRVWTEERGAPIFVCRRQRVSWKKAWPAARHYG